MKKYLYFLIKSLKHILYGILFDKSSQNSIRKINMLIIGISPTYFYVKLNINIKSSNINIMSD